MPAVGTLNVHAGGAARGDWADGTEPTAAVGIRRPWYLERDVPADEAILDEHGRVRAASIGYLIEKLTRHDAPVDAEFTCHFLLTYPTFVSDADLVALLRRRFQMVYPPRLDCAEFEQWRDLKQRPVRARVLSFVRAWIAVVPTATLRDSAFVASVGTFLRVVDHEGLHAAAQQLREALDERLAAVASRAAGMLAGKRRSVAGPLGSSAWSRSPSPEMTTHSLSRRMRSSSTSSGGRTPPVSILPRSLARISLLQIDPLELARQLTLLEWRLWVAIEPADLLRCAWSAKRRSGVPAGAGSAVRAVIDLSNRVTYWIASAILSETELKQRCLLIKHFILVGDRCRGLNNFNTLMSILAALNSASVHRLSRTWEAMSAKAMGYLRTLQALLAPERNFAQYRRTLAGLVALHAHGNAGARTITSSSPTAVASSVSPLLRASTPLSVLWPMLALGAGEPGNSDAPVSGTTAAVRAVPCIPFLGMYLTDLTFIEDGNPDLVPRLLRVRAPPPPTMQRQASLAKHNIPRLHVQSLAAPNCGSPAPTASVRSPRSPGTSSVAAALGVLALESPSTPNQQNSMNEILASYLDEDDLSVLPAALAPVAPPARRDSQLINFAKRAQTGAVLAEVLSLQSEPYVLREVPELQQYLHLVLEQDALMPRALDVGLLAGGVSRSRPTSPSDSREPVSVRQSISLPSSPRDAGSAPSSRPFEGLPSLRPSRSPVSRRVPPANARRSRDLYELSLDIEPRERSDEKIARLLHESGFL